MENNLLQKLKEWRKKTANTEGVPVFRVFSNAVLEAVAQFEPADKEALFLIKGIRDRKYDKYGEAVLALVNEEQKEHEFFVDNFAEGKKPFSVSDYLDFLNNQLSQITARIQGEISSLDVRERVIYFSLKDSEEGSVINCLIWKNVYEMSGVEFEIGMEVVLEGCPDVYKPSGRLSFKVSSAELVGEGALKKAYDLLKKRLEAEGLFAIEKKRPVPNLPQKIGLITSATGAVIHDFSTNLGRYGFQIKFIDSKVEGQVAVRGIISAIDYFNGIDIDVLVIIRGGGSLESLQAFNNENLVRKIASFHKPIICGIGHDKDIPLVSLVADKMVSTPTAVAHTLNESWQKAVHKLDLNKEKTLSIFKDFIFSEQKNISKSFDVIKRNFQSIFDNFNKVEESLKRYFVSIKFRISEINRNIIEYPRVINGYMKSLIKDLSEKTNLGNTLLLFKNSFNQIKEHVLSAEKLIIKSDPEKQLNLGYSIVKSGGVLIRKINQIKKGQMVNVWVENGDFDSEVKNINKK